MTTNISYRISDSVHQHTQLVNDECREQGAHSRISPSKLARVLDCPASLQMGDDPRIPAPETSAAAARGTQLHDIAATLLLEFFEQWADNDPVRPGCTWGEYLSVIEDNYGESPAVITALTAVSTVMPALQAWGFIEHRVRVAAPPCPSTGIYGSVDLWWLTQSDDELTYTIHVLDFKFGNHPVTARENPQLMAYARGVLETLQHVPSVKLTDTTRVALHIVQPAVYGGVADTWRTNVHDINQWWLHTVAPALIRAEGSLGLSCVAPSPATCRWCPAMAICAPHTAMMEVQALEVFKLHADPQGTVLANEDVFAAFDAIGALEEGVEATKTMVRAILARGPQHGYKLVRARGKRVWADDSSPELAAVLDGIGKTIPDFEYTKTTLVTPPALLKQYPRLRKHEDLAHHITMAQSKTLSVVPDTDPREAVVPPTAAEAFAGYEDADESATE